MNSLTNKLAFFALAAVLTACQPEMVPDSTNIAPQTGNLPAQTTDAGKPIGTPVKQAIGPAGGQITVPVSATSNETVTVTFPAGAFVGSTTIGVQMVENKAPGGIGPAIELSPKDARVNKPVTITWQHGANGLNGTGAAAVGLAHQREDGSWVGKTNLTENETQHTLTAARPTFDLKYPVAFYQNFYLKYGTNDLPLGKQIDLEVAYQPNHSDKAENEGRETLLAPLQTWKPVDHSNLKNWRLNGADPTTANKAWGTLGVHNKGEKAIYIAPAKLPAENPVAISVDLNTGGRSRIILVANLLITGPGHMVAMGNVYNNPKIGVSINAANDYLHVSLTEPDPLSDNPALVFFRIRNFKGPGVYKVDQNNDPDVIISGKEGGKDGQSYLYLYTQGSKTTWTSGTITITEYTGKKGIVAGRFGATLYNYNKDKNVLKSNLFGGEFRASIN